MKTDEKFMRIAIQLAEKSLKSSSPVGAVIVKNGKIIGKGYHKKDGSDHAEIMAIKSVKNKSKIKGSTLYVSLEPCSHYGKTPPCTNSIIKFGIKRVVYAIPDPTKKVRGKEILKKHKIQTTSKVLEKEAKRAAEIFLHYSKKKLPFVAIKVAMTKNGKIGIPGKEVKITGKKSHEYVHKLRSRYQSILVGINTILSDNPKLTSRIKGGRNPTKIILDSTLKIPLSSNVLKSKTTIIATTKKYNKERRKKLEKKGVKIWILGKSKINLKNLLKKLGSLGINSLLVEGGAKVHESFIKQKLVNKFYIFINPKKTLKNGIDVFGSANLKRTRLDSIIHLGPDLLKIKYPFK